MIQSTSKLIGQPVSRLAQEFGVQDVPQLVAQLLYVQGHGVHLLQAAPGHDLV
jgi:hypothetical protein